MQTQTGTNSADAELELNIDWAALLTGHTFIVFVLTCAAGLLRWHALAGVDFPPGNGSLLAAAAESLLAGGRFSLTIDYNGGAFPFLYPPVGPALAATISTWRDAPLLDVLRGWPAVFGALSVPLFYGLSYRLLQDKLLSITAAVAFLLMPSVTVWTLTDDALARAAGLCLALITLILSHALIVRRDENLLLPAGLGLAITALTAPELAYFVLYTLPLWLVAFGRNRYSLLNTLLMLLVALAIVSVWLLPLAIAAGLLPFIDAAGTVFYPLADIIASGQIRLPANAAQTVPLVGTLGALGFFVAVARGRVFLPLWLLLIPLLHPRSAAMLTALPLALLAALAVQRLILPLILQTGHQHYAEGLPVLRYAEQPTLRKLNAHLYRLPALLMVAGLLLYALASLLISTGNIEARAIPAPERNLMQTVIADNEETLQEIPPDARFFVLTGAESWEQDAAAAWFPVLTERENVLLVPGSAWQADFDRRQRYAALNACLNANVNCLERLEAQMNGLPVGSPDITPVFTHLYISPGTNGTLVGFLRRSERFTLLSSSGGARIYQRASN